MSGAEWVIVVVLVVGVIAALFGWDRYRSGHKPAGAASQPTDEVFTDPATGKTMRVWYDRATGEREYRQD